MSIDSQPIVQSLERASELCEDPTLQVYERLFETLPQVKEQFILDTDNAAKGQMLFQFFECILDFVDQKHFSTSFLQCEMVNHQGLGIEQDMFFQFFPIVRDTLKDILSGEWSSEMDSAWSALITDLQSELS